MFFQHVGESLAASDTSPKVALKRYPGELLRKPLLACIWVDHYQTMFNMDGGSVQRPIFILRT